MDGLIPASGAAARMRGIPKFLLPCDEDYLTLLERHVSKMLEHCQMVWIPTRPELTINDLQVSVHHKFSKLFPVSLCFPL